MKKKVKILVAFVAIAIITGVMAQGKVFAFDRVETKTISSVNDLVNAIINQEDNQVWEIQEGTYVLTAEDLAKYSSWGDPSQNTDNSDANAVKATQGNWYFPIHKNNITIKGIGNVTITSDVETPNGNWASQDFISIWGDNVTIDGINIKCKKEQNKAIEVMGKNATLKNINLEKVDENGSGSIIFNSLAEGNSIGNATVENVTLYSWISATYSKGGNLKAKDVTINFTDNAYAGYSDETLGYAWRPLINVNSDIELENSDFKIIVDDDINLAEQVFIDSLPENTTIVLAEDISVDKMLNITNSNVTLDLNGHILTASDDFTSGWANKNDAHLLQVYNAKNVTIKNGSLVTTENNKHGINLYNSDDVVLENVAVDNTDTLGGAPIVINNSTALVKGQLALAIGENSWYGINVDPKEGNASLTFAEDSNVSMEGATEDQPIIELEGDVEKISVSGVENAGLKADENGNYVIAPIEPSGSSPEENPNTGDNLLTSVIMSIVGLVGLTGSVYFIRKRLQ